MDNINHLTAIGNELERLVKLVDELRGSEPGAALEATGITGLARHVLAARDDLEQAADMVDCELGRLVRRSVTSGAFNSIPTEATDAKQ